MANDLISRQAVEKMIQDGLNETDPRKRFGNDGVRILAEVHHMHAVDAAPVVHTKIVWLSTETSQVVVEAKVAGDYLVLCKPDDIAGKPLVLENPRKTKVPTCGKCRRWLDDCEVNWCPYCGAKMDEKAKKGEQK